MTRWTAVAGNALDAKTTRERGQRAASSVRYSRARARSAGSSTTSAGVPNSSASVSARQPVRHARLEALVEQRDLEVVAHAAVDGDELALAGDDAIEGRRVGRDHAAARLDDDLRLRRQVLAGGADQRVQVLRDARRMVGVGVARAEPAAEVVDLELAQGGDRRDRVGERLDGEDLRADVHVQPAHPQPR
jgi:hypothetical protein